VRELECHFFQGVQNGLANGTLGFLVDAAVHQAEWQVVFTFCPSLSTFLADKRRVSLGQSSRSLGYNMHTYLDSTLANWIVA